MGYNGNGDDMKKIILILTSLLLVTGCGNNSIYKNYEVVNKSSEKHTTTIELTYEEYENKIKNKDSFVLLMWQTGCSHCISFEPTLNKIITYYNLEIYSINLANITDEEYSKIENKTFITGTPTTVVFKDGVTQTKKLIGDKESKDVLDFLTRYNYLKEVK
mgnify:FL=1